MIIIMISLAGQPGQLGYVIVGVALNLVLLLHFSYKVYGQICADLANFVVGRKS